MSQLIQRIPSHDRDAAEAIWRSRVGRPVSDIQDELMDQYLTALRPVLKPDELRVLDSSFFAVFPTGDFEARVVESTGGDKVVLIHQGITNAMALIAHWYVRFLEEGGRLDYLLDMKRQIHFVGYLVLLWKSRFGAQTDLPDVYPTTADGWELSEALAFAAIAFVLCHEIGHMVEQHGAYTDNTSENHRMETAADTFSADIVVRYALIHSLTRDSYFTRLMLFAPHLVLFAMSLLNETSTATHPNPTVRSDNVASAIRTRLGRRFADAPDLLYENLDSDVFGLLDRNRTNLIRLSEHFGAMARQMAADVSMEPALPLPGTRLK